MHFYVILAKPRLVEEPRDVEVTFGGTVFFSCKAEGEPHPNIVWMRDRYGFMCK